MIPWLPEFFRACGYQLALRCCHQRLKPRKTQHIKILWPPGWSGERFPQQVTHNVYYELTYWSYLSFRYLQPAGIKRNGWWWRRERTNWTAGSFLCLFQSCWSDFRVWNVSLKTLFSKQTGFVLLVYLFICLFWRRRVSNGREKKMGRQRSIVPLSLQAAGVSSIPSYSYALSRKNPHLLVIFC